MDLKILKRLTEFIFDWPVNLHHIAPHTDYYCLLGRVLRLFSLTDKVGVLFGGASAPTETSGLPSGVKNVRKKIPQISSVPCRQIYYLPKRAYLSNKNRVVLVG